MRAEPGGRRAVQTTVHTIRQDCSMHPPIPNFGFAARAQPRTGSRPRTRDLPSAKRCYLGEKLSLSDHVRCRSRRPAVTDRHPGSGYFRAAETLQSETQES